MARRAVGSNQYKTRRGVDVSASAGELLGQVAGGIDRQVRCGEVWGTKCKVAVAPPYYSHGNHGAYGNPLKAIRSPNCPPSVLELLVRMAVGTEPGPNVSWQAACRIAQHPNCTPEILGQLLIHPKRQVREVIMRDPRVPLSGIQVALQAHRITHQHAAKHPAMDSQACTDMAYSSEPWWKAAAAASSNCPPQVLAYLMSDPTQDTDTLTMAAANPNTPPEALMAVVSNPDRSTLPQLPGGVPRAMYGLLQNPALDENALREVVRRVLARRSPDFFPGRWVYRKALQHPNCPPDVIEKARSETDPECLSGLAENPNCPTDVLVQLAQHKAAEVRVRAVRNLSTPLEIIVRRSRDTSINVREALASNPQCPGEVLVEMLHDAHPQVRAAAKKNPNLPEEYRALMQLAR
jgi:hypothetical protein